MAGTLITFQPKKNTVQSKESQNQVSMLNTLYLEAETDWAEG